jgi:hypothetical protein
MRFRSNGSQGVAGSARYVLMRGRHHGELGEHRPGPLRRAATSTVAILALITVIAVVVVANVNFGKGSAAGPPADTNLNDLMAMSSGFQMSPEVALAEANEKEHAHAKAVAASLAAQHNAKLRAKLEAQQAAWAALKKKMSSDPTAEEAKQVGKKMNAAKGWSDCWSSLETMWDHESSWDSRATNPAGGAYGIPQALPGSKMASAGSDWQVNAMTQITWGLGYIATRYGDPCKAWTFWQAHQWY